MDEDRPKPRPSVSKLSKTPSWVMLGFIIGALFVLALPKRDEPAPRPIVVAPASAAKAEVPHVTTIEAVFADWSQYAVWDNDTTQVALWNSTVGGFAEFYEVRRSDGHFYFRSLPHLTNRIIQHGTPVPSDCPLRFTETEAQYRDWRENGRVERPAEETSPETFRPQADRPKPTVAPTTSAVEVQPPPPASPTKDNP